MNIKEFLYKNKHAITILYLPFYMTWFTALEKRQNVNFADMHCIIDDWIPFCEVFIIPYLIWFFYVIASLVFLYFQWNRLQDFYYCIALLILGMTSCLLIYTFLPNGQSLRPDVFPRNNIFTQAIAVLYSTDTATNVCPSLHVYNSIVIHASLARTELMQKHKGLCYSSLILCILICLSTVFLKQHSVIDGLAAILMFLIYDGIVNRFSLFQREPFPAE